jgi:hypothetical protein
MNEYQVEMFINSKEKTLEFNIKKMVKAKNELDALTKAIEKVKQENPELNILQIDTWHIEKN